MKNLKIARCDMTIYIIMWEILKYKNFYVSFIPYIILFLEETPISKYVNAVLIAFIPSSIVVI